VLKEIKTGSFETVLGPIRLDKQILDGATFMIGQWQNGVFQGIAPMDKPGVKAAILPKAAWK
jgi:branched-chain amino acid transport system substrate-binding protein